MLSRLTFWDIFDVYRVLIGAVAAEMLFVSHAAVRREKFALRVLTGSVLCALAGILYIPFFWMQHAALFGNFFLTAMISSAWWLLLNIAAVCFAFACYDISPCNLMFHCVLGMALEHFISIILQYLICKKWFPDLQSSHPVGYVCLTLAIYAIFLSLAYVVLLRRGTERGTAVVEESRKTFLGYCAVFLFLYITGDVTNVIFHWANYDEQTAFGTVETLRHYAVPYYCIAVNLIICTVVIILQTLIYQVLSLQQEKKLLQVLQREKEQQYLFSRENMDIINQKCHDLKRQIRALKFVKEEERERLFAEAEQAVQFYDARICTGNEVLDTILTEKSMLCAGQGIRFTCNIKMEHIACVNAVDVVDLYTLLGNALDNAIECTAGYEDPDKKTISVTLVERGSMLNILVDNYYEGGLKLKNGLPVTTKADKRYHGYGVKSMRLIAGKYDGDMQIYVRNHTFSLQIMLPLDIQIREEEQYRNEES